MRLRDLGLLVGTASVSMFAYGMLVESKRLVAERHTLALRGWPDTLAGFKIAVLADLHLRGRYSLELAQRAVAMALDEQPDMIVLAGDIVDYWKADTVDLLYECLYPLLLMEGSVVAVPGNHDYFHEADAGRLVCALEPLNIRLLRNQAWRHKGVTWVGIDSAVERVADPELAMRQVREPPAIAIWHEPDVVDELPPGCALQISGHSHGGQFRFPFGITPAGSYLGTRYREGFFPDASTPLYVSRGIGTTGPPSRFLCPPEVSVLTLVPA